MKFGKWLKKQIEQSLPEWREQFVSYKELKQIVGSISGCPPSPADEAEFVALLDSEIDKINAFFLEQEEEFIIMHRELQEVIKTALERKAAVPAAQHEAEIAEIRREIVNFHGEMVLLLNYSSINYIGAAKILKKYDKRTGGVLRLPVIETVREQPFFKTETVSQMVRECEAMMEAVFPTAPEGQAAARRDRDALAAAEQRIFRNTVAALLTMQDVRSGSSTHGRHSLPPLTLPDSDWLRSFQPPSPIPIQ
ncbi:hypothetical protein GUJ93_ZPchr0007g4933 [Zizania palustris]|uniref:SPX domain-containing protein n=1 Tax=Zizania palustris TaxID=103762 RepID=A0A8J5W4X3_ZIZPA|nr:hypothetical protein GUJ93_ZPchr0007g4933 [Zizania palustris]